MNPDRTYIQVLLPVKLRWVPTYRAPEPLERGRRVCVELGGRRYDGVVWCSAVQPDLPEERIQDIVCVQDELPAVTAEELRFWEFLASYYLCTLGEVYKAAYPLLKQRSEQTAADILSRLQDRLRKREEALARPHSERVTARLNAERDALLAELALWQRRQDAPGRKTPPGKPLVLTAPDRREAYLPAINEILDAGRQALRDAPRNVFIE
ncbi:MAG: hypothetical protein IKX62_04890, partial [Bacteroidales bacterium]|nr:hypothetical protein [Bacteroidales bacterium]